MKSLLAVTAFAIMSISTSSFAQNIYADIQVTDINPTSNFIWKRANIDDPIYPAELARSRVTGCSVLSFNISDTGKTENIEVIKSVPQKQLGKYSRKMLKKWKWVPASTVEESAPEKRTLRLDFCMGVESTEQSEKACKQQTKLACE